MANNTLQKVSLIETTKKSLEDTIQTDINGSVEFSTQWEELIKSPNDDNSTNVEQIFLTNSTINLTLLESFIVLEIVMTALELIIWIIAAIKVPKWRRNYRNQMLVQLSLARFLKRVFFLFQYFAQHKLTSTTSNTGIVLNSFQIYVDFVIVTLVFIFIKHMYDSLIIVMVKVTQASLNKILICAWLIPIPISAVWTGIILGQLLDKWMVYFLICCLFRWPMMLLGTWLYVTILYRVLSDQIRRFARSLTITTFFMCLVTNFYLFSKDVIELWCLKSFLLLLISYLSGFLLNFLILTFYIVLIIISVNNNKNSRSFPEYSIANGM